MTSATAETAAAFDPEGGRLSWQAFVDAYWEQAPCVVDTPPTPFDLSADELFEKLCLLRVGGRPLRGYVRFYRGADIVPQNEAMAQYLPDPADGGWDGYQARMDESVGDDWLLLVNNAQRIDFDTFDRARAFVAPLVETLGGLPSGGVDFSVFAGRYRRSALGLHRDTLSVFMFVLQGEKAIVTFDDNEGAEVGTFDYEHLRHRATVLSPPPGGFAYWPTSAWHIGEPSGFSVSAHLGFQLLDDPWETFLSALRPLLPRLRVPTLAPPGGLPAHLSAPVDALAELASSDDVRARLAELWLRRTTAWGFRHMPPAASAALTADRVLRGDGRWPILVAPVGADAWACSANGRSLRLTGAETAAEVRSLVASLMAGAAVRVGDLASDDARRVADALASWRAVSVDPAA